MKHYLTAPKAAELLGVDEESLPSFVKISRRRTTKRGKEIGHYSKWRVTRAAKEKYREWQP